MSTMAPSHERLSLDDAIRGEWEFDRVIILLVGALMTLGATIVYSASVSLAAPAISLQNWWHTPLRQCVFVVIGFIWMLFVAALPHRLWACDRPGTNWLTGGAYVLCAFLLLVMLGLHEFWPGRGDPARAIQVLNNPPISFQPAEIAKVVAVLWFAALAGRAWVPATSWRRSYVPIVAGVGLLVGLVALEDYGTAAVIGVVFLMLHWIAGFSAAQIGATCLMGAAAGVAFLIKEPYRMKRIFTFMNPNSDEAAASYQITQSLIAVGSGGWWGRGLGQGVQKYGYLPQDNNDFIYAILCEELGIVGGLGVVAIFLVLLWRGWWIAERASDPFDRLLAAGITLTLALQAAFNVAVVIDVVPTKGISLPFVSAGGSGVIFLGTAAGLLASVGGRTLMRRGKPASRRVA